MSTHASTYADIEPDRRLEGTCITCDLPVLEAQDALARVAKLEDALVVARRELETLYIARTRVGEEETAWATVLDAITLANGLLGNRVFEDEAPHRVGEGSNG